MAKEKRLVEETREQSISEIKHKTQYLRQRTQPHRPPPKLRLPRPQKQLKQQLLQLQQPQPPQCKQEGIERQVEDDISSSPFNVDNINNYSINTDENNNIIFFNGSNFNDGKLNLNNKAFSRLKNVLPKLPHDKLSKIQTIKLAAYYINFMYSQLKENE
ncbi:hypothetical protein HELRODRAFT_176734 [Helobdella robusta]|uniref:BHLH domain-containing protein n=1 Tax=Helobdella robusta TaxID=6412 RepID=T1FAU7_HELRO|nr:hypothetical protein HELRODRAFT_176734 [Helobdella robusta]ESN99566.1 hypothetical protein HELRODRAFT_176734 [Helobdella robusta]